jgi:hypothetical protein
MNKRTLVAALSLLTLGATAQYEMPLRFPAYRSNAEKTISTVKVRDVRPIAEIPTIALTMVDTEAGAIDSIGDRSWANNPPVEEVFGSGFFAMSDPENGCIHINMDKAYPELMIFVKNDKGKMVAAQLLQNVDSALLPVDDSSCRYRIEILSNLGNKATLTVPMEEAITALGQDL